MKRALKAAIFAAGLVVAFGATAGAEDMRPVSLTSFGAAQTLSAYQLSSAGLIAMSAPASVNINTLSGAALLLPTATGFATPQPGFASSLALSPHLALDGGYNLDIAKRFGDYDSLQSPLLSSSFLGLANGGNYAGVTWMPSTSLALRAGASIRDNRLGSFSFDPVSGGLPLPFDTASSHALLAGLSWTASDWASFGLDAIHNDQTGLPLGFNAVPGLTSAGKTSTSALDVSARFKLGDNWVSNVSYSEGLTQLDQRSGPAAAQDSHSYVIAIAKHGLFGDDALGFSLSRPPAGLLQSGFDMVAATGDLPPSFAAAGQFADRTPETDLQLGYVTNFLTGVELQANASYQMNYQGQPGATSLSLLSRAKIKF